MNLFISLFHSFYFFTLPHIANVFIVLFFLGAHPPKMKKAVGNSDKNGKISNLGTWHGGIFSTIGLLTMAHTPLLCLFEIIIMWLLQIPGDKCLFREWYRPYTTY